MRGTHGKLTLAGSWDGIIPAHAGNTTTGASRSTARRDHPRACGEHMRWLLLKVPGQGSSPRMRGTPYSRFPDTPIIGIIPAHAGNTGLSILHGILDRDHPRACGEHPFIPVLSSLSGGSSPRMRGTHVGHCAEVQCPGIIPAHAGNTIALWVIGHECRDHPRACGEHINPLKV